MVTLTEREESINGPNNDSKSGVYNSARGGHENLRGELDPSGDIYLAGEKFNLAPGGTENAEVPHLRLSHDSLDHSALQRTGPQIL